MPCSPALRLIVTNTVVRSLRVKNIERKNLVTNSIENKLPSHQPSDPPPFFPSTAHHPQLTQLTQFFFFPAVLRSSSLRSISLISFSSARFAYHCPACKTKTPTNTSARIVLLAANTLNVSSLLI